MWQHNRDILPKLQQQRSPQLHPSAIRSEHNGASIPADAFYDWKKNGKAQQPFCFEVGDGEMFAFAGLWDRWIDPQGKEIESCTIITTTPNSHLADIHDRMPVILPSAAYASWLTPAMRDSSVALTGSRPLPVPCDDTR